MSNYDQLKETVVDKLFNMTLYHGTVFLDVSIALSVMDIIDYFVCRLHNGRVEDINYTR